MKLKSSKSVNSKRKVSVHLAVHLARKRPNYFYDLYIFERLWLVAKCPSLSPSKNRGFLWFFFFFSYTSIQHFFNERPIWWPGFEFMVSHSSEAKLLQLLWVHIPNCTRGIRSQAFHMERTGQRLWGSSHPQLQVGRSNVWKSLVYPWWSGSTLAEDKACRYGRKQFLDGG